MFFVVKPPPRTQRTRRFFFLFYHYRLQLSVSIHEMLNMESFAKICVTNVLHYLLMLVVAMSKI
jgi:hypothetical protein